MRKYWIKSVAMAVLFSGFSMLNARVPIPGIDKIPKAVDPGEYRPHYQDGEEVEPESPDQENSGEQEPAANNGEEGGTPTPTPTSTPDGQKKPEGEKPEETKNEEEKEELPMVRDLKSEIVGEAADTVKLTWTLAPGSDTVLYVVRYARPISTRERLFEAYNLTSPPLKTGTLEFSDEKIPEGTYYYAVISSYEVSLNEKIKLEDGKNFLSAPVSILKKKPVTPDSGLEGEKTEEPEEQPYVESLVAVNTDKSVKLSWKKLKKEKGIYNIYRSEEPLDKPEAFDGATRLGAIPVSQAQLEDNNPLAGKQVYYGVAYLDPDGTEYRELVLNSSYIQHEFKGPEEQPTAATTISNLPENLTAEKAGSSEVKINWQDPDSELNGFNIYRSATPIYNIGQLDRAELIGFARKGRGEYQDKNLEPGSYFYGVFPVTREGVVVQDFQEGKTFTGFPVELTEETGAEVASEDQFAISGIVAVDSDKSVKLSWKPAVATGIFYTVYRIPRSRTGKTTLSSGQKLGYANETGPFFEDRSPVADQEVFYAVTVNDRATSKEYQNLVFKESYINHTYVSPDLGDTTGTKGYLPETLVTYLQNASTVKLMWVDPTLEIKGLQVYRSDRPISSERALEKAEAIGRVSPGESSYVDSSLEPGQYFYALIPINPEGKEVRVFEEGRSFTGFAVNIRKREPGEEPEQAGDEEEQKEEERQKIETGKLEMEYFRASPAGDGTVQLYWSVKKPEKNQQDFRINLFRATRPLRNIETIQSSATRVEDVDGKLTEYADKGLSPGSYYYAALIEINGGVSTVMEPEKNFTTTPAVVESRNAAMPDKNGRRSGRRYGNNNAGPQFDDYAGEEKVNAIIGETYLKQDYRETVDYLKDYLDSEEGTEGRGRALFYMGLSYYQMEEYDKALESFLSPEASNKYPERSRFWAGRTLERINEMNMKKGKSK